MSPQALVVQAECQSLSEHQGLLSTEFTWAWRLAMERSITGPKWWALQRYMDPLLLFCLLDIESIICLIVGWVKLFLSHSWLRHDVGQQSPWSTGVGSWLTIWLFGVRGRSPSWWVSYTLWGYACAHPLISPFLLILMEHWVPVLPRRLRVQNLEGSLRLPVTQMSALDRSTELHFCAVSWTLCLSVCSWESGPILSLFPLIQVLFQCLSPPGILLGSVLCNWWQRVCRTQTTLCEAVYQFSQFLGSAQALIFDIIV